MDEAPMNRFGLRVALSVGGLVGLAFFCAGLVKLSERPRNGIRVEDLAAELPAAVPPGSPREQAEAWFAGHGFRYGMMTNADTGRPVGYHAQVENDSWLEQAEIRIAVRFDDAGRVSDVTIYRFVVSL